MSLLFLWLTTSLPDLLIRDLSTGEGKLIQGRFQNGKQNATIDFEYIRYNYIICSKSIWTVFNALMVGLIQNALMPIVALRAL